MKMLKRLWFLMWTGDPIVIHEWEGPSGPGSSGGPWWPTVAMLIVVIGTCATLSYMALGGQ